MPSVLKQPRSNTSYIQPVSIISVEEARVELAQHGMALSMDELRQGKAIPGPFAYYRLISDDLAREWTEKLLKGLPSTPTIASKEIAGRVSLTQHLPAWGYWINGRGHAVAFYHYLVSEDARRIETLCGKNVDTSFVTVKEAHQAGAKCKHCERLLAKGEGQ